MNIDYSDILERLKTSPFRAKFSLDAKDKEYISKKGMDVIESHARDFIKLRLSPANILNDGKQTPMRGHPVFKAQHACACCCRGCLEKWHKIPKGFELTNKEQEYIVGLLMAWIKQNNGL